ncbi:hypothetical protein FJY68_09685 [candidate division WOR-3 bacterium]|uniref:Right-handed parallel beta-helix repeat-containing protein n=1 Tax=candidate division WOR-3 bacterium TaxID=2052148 RepID=A0A938BUL8_UNCW3|nr:hypothetical protein [candidate division WOR-3 bacterium]
MVVQGYLQRKRDEGQRRSSYIGRSSSFFALLSSLFSLFLLGGCPGEDITPPEVVIIAPADGDTIAGPVTVRARATDNKRVVSVEFLVDGVRLGADSSPTGQMFEFAWLGLMRPGSTHTLSCSAADAAGNRSSSPEVTVHVSSSAGKHHSGTIGMAETWEAASSPHVVDSDLFIEAMLTLEPGTVVLVADGATVAVGTRSPAGIFARGKADSVITFSTLSTAPAPGAWNGILFRANTVPGGSLLRHCLVEYAGGGGYLVKCEAGGVAIDSSEFFSSSGSGVSASGGGLASLAGSVFSACARFPVSVSPGLVSAITADNKFSDNYRNAIEIPGGTVAATDTWTNLGFPYAITATLTVADSTNPLLYVAPGCSLLFADSARLRVGLGKPGALRADGTYGRVVFGPLVAGSGQWRGLEFWEQTDPVRTILNFCSIEAAGASNAAAITCYAEVLIANTKVSGSAGTGIYCQNTGFARFENDTITGCGGFPLRIAAQYVGTIGNGNSFTGNADDAIEVAGGNVASNAQYRQQGVPYLIRETIEVGSALEPTLLIENGVELRFASGAALAVGRTARASLQADSVTLTGAAAQPGAWDGLELHRYTTSTSRVERSRLLYGGGANRGIVFVDSCVPVLTGNEIAFSSNYCVFMRNTELDPDTIRSQNWLHNWDPGFDDVYYAP